MTDVSKYYKTDGKLACLIREVAGKSFADHIYDPNATLHSFSQQEAVDFLVLTLEYLLKKENKYYPTKAFIERHKYYLGKYLKMAGLKKARQIYKIYSQNIFTDSEKINLEEHTKRKILVSIMNNNSSIFGYGNLAEIAEKAICDARLMPSEEDRLKKYYSVQSKFTNADHVWQSKMSRLLRMFVKKQYPLQYKELDVTPSKIRTDYLQGPLSKQLPKKFLNQGADIKLRILFEEDLKNSKMTFKEALYKKPQFSPSLQKIIQNDFSSKYDKFLLFIYGNVIPKEQLNNFVGLGRKKRPMDEKNRLEKITELCLMTQKKMEQENAFTITTKIALKTNIYYKIKALFNNDFNAFKNHYQKIFLNMDENQCRNVANLHFIFGDKTNGAVKAYLSKGYNATKEIIKTAKLNTKYQILLNDVIDNYSGQKQSRVNPWRSRLNSVRNNKIRILRSRLKFAFYRHHPDYFKSGLSSKEIYETSHKYLENCLTKKKQIEVHFLEIDAKEKLNAILSYALQKEHPTHINFNSLTSPDLLAIIKKYNLTTIYRYFFNNVTDLFSFADDNLKPHNFKYRKKWDDPKNILTAIDELVEQLAKNTGQKVTDLDEEILYSQIKKINIIKHGWRKMLEVYPDWKLNDYLRFYSVMSNKIKISKHGTLNNVLQQVAVKKQVERELLDKLVSDMFKFYDRFKGNEFPYLIARLYNNIVRAVINKYFKYELRNGHSFEELEKIGLEELASKISKNYPVNYSRSMGAWCWVVTRRSIERSLCKYYQTPTWIPPAKHKLYKAMLKLNIHTINSSNIDDLCRETGWKRQKLINLNKYTTHTISLDENIRNNSSHNMENSNKTLHDILGDKEVCEVDWRLIEKFEMALENLPVEQRTVFALGAGIIDGEKYKLEDISKIMQISKEKIVAIRSKATRKLQKKAKLLGLNSYDVLE